MGRTPLPLGAGAHEHRPHSWVAPEPTAGNYGVVVDSASSLIFHAFSIILCWRTLLSDQWFPPSTGGKGFSPKRAPSDRDDGGGVVARF